MGAISIVRRHLLAIVLVPLLVLGACADDRARDLPPGAGPLPARRSAEPTTSAERTSLRDVRGRFTRVASFGGQVTAVTSFPGRDELFVGMRQGAINEVELVRRRGAVIPTVVPKPVVDLTSVVKTEGEAGLFDLKFDATGDSLLASYAATDGTLTVVAIPYDRSRRTLRSDASRTVLAIDHPLSSHYGGGMAVEATGNVLLAVGDMSLEYADPAAQRPGSPLGGIVRIPRRALTADRPAAVADLQILARGLRNPWRIGLDRTAHVLWIGDVGDLAREELDRLDLSQTSVPNFGWPFFEGTQVRSSPPAGMSFAGPTVEYPHATDACAVMAGRVYRGAAVPGLQGAFVFGDFCSDRVRAVTLDRSGRALQRTVGTVPGGVITFGEGPWFELYAADQFGNLYRLDATTWSAPNVRVPKRFEVPTTTEAPRAIDPRACDLGAQFEPLKDVYQDTPDQARAAITQVIDAVRFRVSLLPPEMQADGKIVIDGLDATARILDAAGWQHDLVLQTVDDIYARRGPFGPIERALTRIIDTLASSCR